MQIVHFEVAGHVQGVGFRHYLRQHAARLQLVGWARNLSSGNVEVAASGSAEAIEEFMTLVRQGPQGATIKQIVNLQPAPTIELPRPFTILR